MRTNFYKSLDKPLDIIGLKGSWISIFLYCVGGALVAGLLIGIIVNAFVVGFIFVVVGIVLSYFVCITLQLKASERQVVKAKVESKVSGWVLRRESLSRILLEDPGYKEVQRLKNARKT